MRRRANLGALTGLALLAAPLAAASASEGDETTDQLYQTHCASCHGADRLGGMGPALLPENWSP